MNKLFLLLAAISITVVFPSYSFAHPGRTASDGCHYCRTNCDSWGVPWNERHCHNGYAAPVVEEQPVYVPPTLVPTIYTPPTVIVWPTNTPFPPTNTPVPPTSTPTTVPSKKPTKKLVPAKKAAVRKKIVLKKKKLIIKKKLNQVVMPPNSPTIIK